MSRYINQTPRNVDKLNYRELLNQTTALVVKSYPALSHDNAQYVAVLMVRHDEDVVEIDGQFIVFSEVSNA